jgi:hypothetical protein
MNTHNQINELLVGFALGELSEPQRQDVEKHLADCIICRTELENIRALLKTTEEMKTKDADEQLCESAKISILASITGTGQEPAIKQINFWRTIMKSKITKLAAAAIIIAATIFSINIIDKSVPAAFGIDQVIAAYNSIRFLHVKQFDANQQDPAEFWIKSDELGRVVKARYYLPKTEDGVKLITWTPEKAELWFKSKNGYLIFQTKRVEGWMQSLIEQSQPKLVMEKLLEEQKAGKVDIDIQKPQGKQEPITITATYKTSPKKAIYYINQATDLITSIEFYHIENNQDVLDSTMEFYDYNVPIDEKMFTLKDEVPKDVTVVNQLEQLIGIPQGNMTDEQAAAETVRQFFQALINKDYKKAGSIFSGISEEKANEYFSRLNVTAIISIGTPTPYPQCGPHSFRVPCEVEITTPDGQKTTWKPYGPFARCGDDEMHPDRWIIHGGI